MDTDIFNTYWGNNYPKALPISYELKWLYYDQWFKINTTIKTKALPLWGNSNTEKRNIIKRINLIINDLFGEGTLYYVLFGLFSNDPLNNNYSRLKGFNQYRKYQAIDLDKIRPGEYEEGTTLTIYEKDFIWKTNSKDTILEAVLENDIRVMFISPEEKCIICIENNRLDVIVDNSTIKEVYDLKYSYC